MNIPARIARHFESSMAVFEASNTVGLLRSGTFDRTHYAAILRQIFHHARENPQIQALATVWFRGEQRELVRPFLKHAAAEVDHDKLAKDDLVALGVDVSSLAEERPLPATTALLSYAFFQIRDLNPLGYLGYLYFLEHLPTHRGGAYAKMLREAGIPAEAMSFLQEHATVDVGHNKLMQHYIEKLIQTDADLSAVQYALDVTSYLYAAMYDQAVATAMQSPADRFGVSPREQRGAGESRGLEVPAASDLPVAADSGLTRD